MKFSINEWRRIYDKVQELGEVLKDSLPGHDNKGNTFPPKTVLTEGAQSILQSEIKVLIKESETYLDKCGKKKSKPLWYYDRKNPETHASSANFKYKNLIA